MEIKEYRAYVFVEDGKLQLATAKVGSTLEEILDDFFKEHRGLLVTTGLIEEEFKNEIERKSNQI